MPEDFQATIIGKTVMPNIPRYSKWGFLRDMLEKLRLGQVIRLILPKGCSVYGVRMAWLKYTQERKVYGHTRRGIKQIDGSIAFYLWYEED